MERKQDDSHVMRYRRENTQRIFVNRNIFLEKIQYIGFDMDYTLAEYISPNYEKLIYKYALKRLINMGYPPEIENFTYNPKFATRGVVFDKRYGNFLKVDPYGNIMSAVHGMDYPDITESRRKYRNRFIDIGDTDRFVIFNTLFEFPSMFLISAVVDYFEKHSEWRLNETQTGVERDSIQIAFKTIFDDVMSVFGKIHTERDMKQETIDNITLYIRKDERLPLLLMRIKDFGRKTFLVTNSDFWYTNCVMSYLFANASDHGSKFSDDWKSYFDIIVVDAVKPKFFAEGTSMCQVDLSTGRKHIGVFKGKISKGDVFTGGNSETLSEILGAQGKDILYVGDHIFGDILKSKKKQGWKTYLVVPELQLEMKMWIDQKDKYKQVEGLEAILSNIYKNMDSCIVKRPPSVDIYISQIRDNIVEIEKSYGVLGSLLRCGPRQTFFSGQLIRFADLYSHTCLNLLYYPFFYLFRAAATLMPHEATIDFKEKAMSMDTAMAISEAQTKRKIPFLKDTKQLTLCAEEMNFNDTTDSGENFASFED